MLRTTRADLHDDLAIGRSTLVHGHGVGLRQRRRVPAIAPFQGRGIVGNRTVFGRRGGHQRNGIDREA